jgi:hypothetical protein
VKHRAIALFTVAGLAVGLMIGLVAAGATAAGGSVRHTRVIQRTFVVRAGHVRVFDVLCPAGYVPVGGGGHFGVNSFPGAAPGFSGILESDIDLSHTGWAVTAYVSSESSRSSFTADAICATWS